VRIAIDLSSRGPILACNSGRANSTVLAYLQGLTFRTNHTELHTTTMVSSLPESQGAEPASEGGHFKRWKVLPGEPSKIAPQKMLCQAKNPFWTPWLC
jgi:hypothetical protein